MIKMTILAQRFRGFYPVVVDVETGGFNAGTDALLELAAVVVDMDETGILVPGECHGYHITPFPGANLNQAALEFNKIDPYHPFRFAIDEKVALTQLFEAIRLKLGEYACQRAVLVGHNPAFDLGFLRAAIDRNKIKNSPFHLFTTFDTATLGALAYGQTVLARAVDAAGLAFDQSQAHSAIYDAKTTAELFCRIVNQWGTLGGWENKSR